MRMGDNFEVEAVTEERERSRQGYAIYWVSRTFYGYTGTKTKRRGRFGIYLDTVGGWIHGFGFFLLLQMIEIYICRNILECLHSQYPMGSTKYPSTYIHVE